MELLVIAALLFFFGIGVVFEVIGFVFHLFFSGFGLIIGLILAAVTALAAVPLAIGIIGIVVPKGFLLIGAVILLLLSTRRYRRDKNRRYGERYY